MVPDSSKRLSDGLVIEACVLARLLGIKLLTLEGTVLVSPAQLRELSVPPSESTRIAPPLDSAPPSPDGSPHATRSDDGVGTRLERAAGLLRASSDTLRGLDEH